MDHTESLHEKHTESHDKLLQLEKKVDAALDTLNTLVERLVGSVSTDDGGLFNEIKQQKIAFSQCQASCQSRLDKAEQKFTKQQEELEANRTELAKLKQVTMYQKGVMFGVGVMFAIIWELIKDRFLGGTKP